MGSPRHRGSCGIPGSVSADHPPQIAYSPQRRPGTSAMPLGSLSSNLLRQYPKWFTGNPGVVRRMQIPEESDTGAEAKRSESKPEFKGSESKSSESKSPDSKGRGSDKRRRLVSAEPAESAPTERT